MEEGGSVFPPFLFAGLGYNTKKLNFIGEIYEERNVVEKIEQLHQNNPKFVQDENFITCIRSWKLKPVNNYSVMLSFGTNSMEDFILISNEEEKIKVIL